jgi:hypothetical protein
VLTRTFWLSFAGDAGHLGVCVVDVTREDVDRTPRHPRATDASWANPEARWMAAAMRRAWQYGCNPGGSIQYTEIPTSAPVPRNRLLTGVELEQWAGRRVVH